MERSLRSRILLSAACTLHVVCAVAQVYLHPTVGMQSTYTGACMVTGCTGTYYDSGGNGANYSDNTNSIFRTFCPNTPGTCVRATFTQFSMNDRFWLCPGPATCCDYLQILNGPVQNSPALYSGCQTSPGVVTANNPSGCLTFRFTSDGSVNLPGWAATLSCVACAIGPTGNTNSDCIASTPVCGDQTFSDASPGPGITAEGCAGCVVSENYTNWYEVMVQSNGTLSFTINPNNNADDFDPVVFGPNVGCGALGTPVRCSYAIGAGNGNTGLGNGASDTSEDVFGDQWVSPINALAGQRYFVMVNGWSPNSGTNGFLLDWTGTASLDCTLLPVELMELRAECEAGTPVLKWITATEQANAGFHIERSPDGVLWEDIGWMHGAGSTQRPVSYRFEDKDPLPLRPAYYRLRQVDVNGIEERSGTLFMKACEVAGGFRLVPNPVEDRTEMIFDTDGTPTGMLEIMIVDALGRTMVQFSTELAAGRSTIPIQVKSLPSGAYAVVLRQLSDGRTLRSRLVKP